MVQKLGNRIANLFQENRSIGNTPNRFQPGNRLLIQKIGGVNNEYPLESHSTTINSRQQVDQGFGTLANESRKIINAAANLSQDALTDIRNARRVLNKEAATLRELEKSIVSEDPDRAELLKAKYLEVQKEKAVLVDSITQHNEERSTNSDSKSIPLASSDLSGFEVRPVQFDPNQQNINLDEVKSIRSRRKEIAVERRGLNSQAREVRRSLGNLDRTHQALDRRSETSSESAHTESDNRVRNFELAEQVAREVSRKIIHSASTGSHSKSSDVANLNHLVIQSLFG